MVYLIHSKCKLRKYFLNFQTFSSFFYKNSKLCLFRKLITLTRDSKSQDLTLHHNVTPLPSQTASPCVKFSREFLPR